MADQDNDVNCDGRYDSCSGDNCDYSASWSVKGSFIQFNVTARVDSDQWVAIGFSDDMFMVCTSSHCTSAVCINYYYYCNETS